MATNLRAADHRQAQKLFFQGQYEECERIARAEVDRGVWNERWPQLLIQCQMATGKYEEALGTFQNAAARFKNSIALRMIGREVYNFAGEPDLAEQQDVELVELVQRTPWRYSSSSDRLVIGRYLLRKGEDAREILELSFDRAKKSNPRLPDPYIATAELAIDKHDYAEAAKVLAKAEELDPNNPYVYFLQAKAWSSSDPEKTTEALRQAIELNPRHVPTLLLRVDNLINAEKYDEAEELLTEVLSVNVRHPEAWAYHAVIAHLSGHATGEKALRNIALADYANNPKVDFLIGEKLSQKYRFAEAAEYQRNALQMDPNYVPAKFQLSQDLLRLGEEEEGWRLADEVHEKDGYNVVAYNLVALHDAMRKFTTLETDRFRLRMEAREARIYGDDVLQWLEDAHEFLCSKYDVELDGPVTVEIFPKQKDFAIRTFGLPGGAGYLGVCFGRVITANSPSSQGDRPANWRSVLWHEFCHVVTLEKTRNKMPRWLSEGISTYEEQEKNPAWGERLNPAYREMILGGELTPVSALSSAFLNPKSGMHLQFAYFESSLVVRYLIENYGIETLKRILNDLSVGMPMNEALSRYAGSLSALNFEFEVYARAKAKEFSDEIEWKAIEDQARPKPSEMITWLSDHPNHYQGTTAYAAEMIKVKKFNEAEKVLLRMRKLHPYDRQPNGILSLLGQLYQQTGDIEKEMEARTKFASINDRALECYSRLVELHAARENWSEVVVNANRYLSVQPMLPRGYEMLATGAEKLGQQQELARSLIATLEMDPIDPAETNFRIATAFEKSSVENPELREKAKRRVLMALEYAPRYREAQKLLLRLIEEKGKDESARESSNVEDDLGS